MSDQSDWLEQTWEIKRQLARKYADVSPSEQLRDMREAVEREWKERGWTLREHAAVPNAGARGQA